MQESDLLAMIDDYFAKAESQPFEMNVRPEPEPEPQPSTDIQPTELRSAAEIGQPEEEPVEIAAARQDEEFLTEQPDVSVAIDETLTEQPSLQAQQQEQLQPMPETASLDGTTEEPLLGLSADKMSAETTMAEPEALVELPQDVEVAEDVFADLGSSIAASETSVLPDAPQPYTVDLSDWSMELLTQRVSGAVFKSMNDAEGNMRSYVDSQIMQLSARERV